ncbi:relaxase/mobilization nuclease domain-containing protein [Burkholderia seminalis]|uniref:Relaxase/mobilization nuclease domain-containing protein n=2 Tax=Burkholderia cepacia complex TaxID=87882 RepID=A0A8A8DEN8_9BURK|nr:relaxase/mobilization nuclease domain-containing protein [Burkholderia seminalis]QTO23254.1 relaxase/mobilization nuclease domain-containing protein [Burkholderia seminalis]
MPYPKIYIDAMLVNWGDRLFHDPLRHPQASRLSHVGIRDAAARMRAQVARTLGRSPEVMVKITNKAASAQGMGAVRRHLRYISRNGRIELEDQNGDRIEGKDAVSDLVKTWQLGGWGIPETSKRRETFNILLSMPPGTDRKAVRDAARDFAAVEFGDGRAYVFAAHNDEAHPHVHLSVQVRGPDGHRLNPRHKDLQRWRERFAEKLRERGVEANATLRRVRGVTQRYPKQPVVHLVARGDTPRYWKSMPTDAQRDAVWVAQGGVFTAWREIAYAMARSGVREDRAMAIEMAYFVGSMPVQRDRPMVGRARDDRREMPDRQVADTVECSGYARQDVER